MRRKSIRQNDFNYSSGDESDEEKNIENDLDKLESELRKIEEKLSAFPTLASQAENRADTMPANDLSNRIKTLVERIVTLEKTIDEIQQRASEATIYLKNLDFTSVKALLTDYIEKFDPNQAVSSDSEEQNSLHLSAGQVVDLLQSLGDNPDDEIHNLDKEHISLDLTAGQVSDLLQSLGDNPDNDLVNQEDLQDTTPSPPEERIFKEPEIAHPSVKPDAAINERQTDNQAQSFARLATEHKEKIASISSDEEEESTASEDEAIRPAPGITGGGNPGK